MGIVSCVFAALPGVGSKSQDISASAASIISSLYLYLESERTAEEIINFLICAIIKLFLRNMAYFNLTTFLAIC